jgi:hypothetical protein
LFQYLNCAGIHYDNSSKSPMPMTAGTRKGSPPLAWPTDDESRSDFPLTLVAAQNEMSLSRRRVAM